MKNEIYRTLIVEDEAKEAHRLTELLSRYGKEHSVKFQTTWHTSGMEMLMDKGIYDLCLLDIEMPGINGMEAAQLLRTFDEAVPIIFVTNLAQYAVKGYEVGAQGFIVKPVTYGSLSLNLDRALRTINQNANRTIVVPTADGIRVIPLRSIIYIDVVKHDLSYHLDDGEIVSSHGSLVQVAKEFTDAPVVRISKNCLVNMNKILQVRNLDIQVSSNEFLKISQANKKQVIDTITDYLGGHR